MTMTLAEIAELVDGRLQGDGDLVITGADTLRNTNGRDLTLVDGASHVTEFEASRAVAALVSHDTPAPDKPHVIVADVRAAFAQVVRHFRPPREVKRIGISPAAFISPSARIADNVDVYPNAVIGDDVVIDAGATIHAGVCIMSGCKIGPEVTIFPNTVLYDNTVVGPRAMIHAGVVLGCHGFGFDVVEGRHQPGPQLGYVDIGADVEIGAGSTIDRGSFGATAIGEGTKIDDQVMIGHNSRIGKHNILCSQVGMAGSCTTGNYVVLAGQVGVRDHVRIDDHVIVGAKSGVGRDLCGPNKYLGIPARPIRQQMQIMFSEEKLPDLRKQIKQLQAQVAELLATKNEVSIETSDVKAA